MLCGIFLFFKCGEKMRPIDTFTRNEVLEILHKNKEEMVEEICKCKFLGSNEKVLFSSILDDFIIKLKGSLRSEISCRNFIQEYQ
jgi:hypothetical protein